MAYVKVAELSKLAPGEVTEIMVDGNPLAVCRLAGKVHAIGGICPHQGGPLGQGALNGARVTCPWHAWEFDCRTGENDFEPPVSVPTYPVEVRGGEVFVDLD